MLNNKLELWKINNIPTSDTHTDGIASNVLCLLFWLKASESFKAEHFKNLQIII